MPNIAEVQAMYRGNSPVATVYRGTQQIWPGAGDTWPDDWGNTLAVSSAMIDIDWGEMIAIASVRLETE